MNLLQLLTSKVHQRTTEKTERLYSFTQGRQVKHTPAVWEPSISFFTLFEHVDLETIRIEKVRTLDQPLEIINVTSKLESHNLSTETYDPNPEIVFTQKTDPNNNSKPQFRYFCKYCLKPNHSVLICFRKQREDEEKELNS